MSDRGGLPSVERLPGWYREETAAALTGSRHVLARAREGIQELQDGIARAARRLEDVDWAQRGGDWPPPPDRRMLLSEFADLCAAAASTGTRVASDLSLAQEGLTSARHAVQEWQPRTESDRQERGRLHHTALGLHRLLEEARLELGRTSAALGRSAAAAREAVPADRSRVEPVHVDLLAQTLRTAAGEGHRVDAAVSRVTSQTRIAVPPGDDTSRAARQRMHAHRDASGRLSSPPPGIGP